MPILGATLLTDRKIYSMTMGLKALVDSALVDEVYVNVQTSDAEQYQSMFAYLRHNCHKPFHIDVWNYGYSNFREQAKFDQDSARLAPICTARNMAVEVAMRPHFSHLLFIDSDVIPVKLDDAIMRFQKIDKPIVGGVVPGRGAHRYAQYVFGVREQISDTIVRCDHGTCGYVMVSRHIYDVVRFRYGPHPVVRDQPLSEDPAYLADAEFMGLADGWYIDYESRAYHIDNEDNPLTTENAHNDYTSLTDKV